MKVLAGIEIKKVLQENKEIKGSYLNKVYQPTPFELILKFHSQKKKTHLKIISGKAIFATQFKYKTSRKIHSFCKLLRKKITRAKLTEIKQIGIDRIVEFHFEKKDEKTILIAELFSKGNFILCNSKRKIIACASPQTWKDREVKKGLEYKLPPLKENVLKSKTEIKKELSKNKTRRAIAVISAMGIGSNYAEEICRKINCTSEDLISKIGIEKTCSGIMNFLGKVEKSTGYIVRENKEPIDATLIKLEKYLKSKTEKADSFNQALDIFFSTSKLMEKNQELEKSISKRKEKIKNIIKNQKKALQKNQKTQEEEKKKGDLIYENYSKIEQLLYEISQMSKKELEDFEKQIKQGNTILPIEKIDQKAKTITLKLKNKLIPLNYKKSLGENASNFYEKSKKAKSKIPSIQKIIKQSKEKLSNLKKNLPEKKPELKKIKKKQWYEKFHWFRTSNNLLAIGGKDATQNEMLIKKHAEKNDLVFHTEMPGSPFFILKNGKQAAEKDKKETAIAVASFSRAWKLGFGSTDVYSISSEQVSKKAKAGEFLGKGAFIIRGSKNFFRNTELELAVSEVNNKIIIGPVSAIKKKAKKYISLKPGYNKKTEIAKKIASKLNIKDINEIVSILPAGNSRIEKITLS